MLPEYPTKIARIGAVLTLMATLVWVQLPMDLTRIGIAPILFFLAAFVAWASVELADWQNQSGYNINMLDEDVGKLNQLTKLVDRKTYYILRNANLETYIGSNDYMGLADLLAYYDEDAFPFHNEKLQSMYEEFQKKSENFVNGLWTLYTADGRGRATWRPGGDGWVSEDHYEKAMGEITILNRQATGLSDAWENFIKVAKVELRGNSVGIVPYQFNI